MIDSEQMRKDLSELLEKPSDWTQRRKHELSALKKLPKLLEAFTKKSGNQKRASEIKEMPEFQRWTESLSALGIDKSQEEISQTTDAFLASLFEINR
jgi:hypothetical protein